MPRARMPFSASSSFGNADCVWHTGLEYIISVNQEYAVIRINIRISLEGFVLAVKHLHPGVRHRAAGRNLVVTVGQNAGRALTAADVGSACAEDGAVIALCTAGAELEHSTAFCRHA